MQPLPFISRGFFYVPRLSINGALQPLPSCSSSPLRLPSLEVDDEDRVDVRKSIRLLLLTNVEGVWGCGGLDKRRAIDLTWGGYTVLSVYVCACVCRGSPEIFLTDRQQAFGLKQGFICV